MWRNDLIKSIRDIYHICDAYACVGGDTIQFMALKPDARIDAVQVNNESDVVLQERVGRLKQNIEYCKLQGLNSSTFVHEMSIKDFISQPEFNTVDFLFLDPPWTNADGKYYGCATLIENLASDIQIQNHFPKYICLKVPYRWDLFHRILTVFPNHTIWQSGSFYHGRFWMHMLILK
jgi:hypothetical protein